MRRSSTHSPSRRSVANSSASAGDLQHSEPSEPTANAQQQPPPAQHVQAPDGPEPSLSVDHDVINVQLALAVSRHDDSKRSLGAFASVCRGWWKAARFQAGYRTRSFRAHASNAWQIVPLPARNAIASAGAGGEVKLWQSDTGRALRQLEVPCDCGFSECDGPVINKFNSQVQSLHVLSDGRLAVCTSFPESKLRVFDLVTKQVDVTIKAGFEGFNVAQELSDSRIATISNNNGDIAIWSLQSGENVKRWRGHVTVMSNWDAELHEDYERETNGELTSLAVLPGQRIVTGCRPNDNFDDSAGTVYCWNTSTGKEGACLWSWKGIAGVGISALTADPALGRLYTGLDNGSTFIWDATDEMPPVCLAQLPRENMTVWQIVLLPQNSIGVAYGQCTCESGCNCVKAGSVVVWDLNDLNALSHDSANTILAADETVDAIAVCPGTGDRTAPIVACAVRGEGGGTIVFCRSFDADPASISEVELDEQRIVRSNTANKTCRLLMVLAHASVRQAMLQFDFLGLRSLCQLRLVSCDMNAWGTQALASVPAVRFLGGKYEEDCMTNHSNGPMLVSMVQRLDPVSMQWVVDMPLPKCLSSASPCALEDGRIVVCGGITNSAEYSCEHIRTADSFLLGPEGWSADELPAMPERVSSAACCVLRDGRLLVIGGCVDGPSADDCESDTVKYEYDAENPRSCQWGDNGWTTAKTTAFDFNTGEWSSLAEMSVQRSDFALGVLDDGRIIVAGGEVITIDWHEDPEAAKRPQTRSTTASLGWYENRKVTLTDSVEIYDPVQDEWTTVAPMLEKRTELAGCVVNGQFVISGGIAVGCGTDSISNYPLGCPNVETYDAATDSWSALPDMLVPRYGHGMCAFGSDILVIGNDSKVRIMSRLGISRPPASEQHIGPDLFDTLSNSWHTLPVKRPAEMKRPDGMINGDGWLFQGSNEETRKKLLEAPQANLRGYVGCTYPLGMTVVCGGDAAPFAPSGSGGAAGCADREPEQQRPADGCIIA
jgi:WD40 repeat protein